MKSRTFLVVCCALVGAVALGFAGAVACTPSPARAYTPPIYAWDDKARGVTCYWHEAAPTDGPGFSCVRTRP
jgi:hypothetical protein